MSVGLVIVSHSAQLARGVVELAGQMTQEKVMLADAGGGEGDNLGTSVDKIYAAIQRVVSPEGTLVLLDLGSALLSAEMALEMLDDEQRARTQVSYAPLVEGTLAAALEASLGHTLLQVRQAAEKAAQVEQLRQLKPVEQEEQEVPAPDVQPSQPETTEAAVEQQLTLTNPAGLHARPAFLFVQTAARFQANILLLAKGKQASAKSIMEVLSLGVRQGDTITLRAGGAQASEAIEALSGLVHANFYETVTGEQQPRPVADTEVLRQEQKISYPTHEPWRAISTSPGVAVGPALLYSSGTLTLAAVSRRAIAADQVTREREALLNAVSKNVQELTALAQELQSSVGKNEAAIFEAQALMLSDPALLDVAQRLIGEQHIDAASAFAEVGEEQAHTLEQLGDELFAQRATDVRDVVSRTIRALRPQYGSAQDLSTLKQPVILVARDLTPSDTAQLRPEMVLGICTVHGGATAHAAILARALGIPAIAGLSEAALNMLHTGDELALDASNGLLYHQPSAEIRAQFLQQLEQQKARRAALQLSLQQELEPLIINGRHVALMANIGSEAEAEAARQWGAEGVGLLRTEFLFSAARTLPGEEEQRKRYNSIFRAFKGAAQRARGPIVVRTLDAGADKPMPALEAVIGTAAEANPALGQRGIRIHLAHQELLAQQLRALLLAAADTGIELHIMFPMIATVEELRMAKAIFERVYAQSRRQQNNMPANVRLGIMVEVPAAALMAAELAQLAEFFSIGANDLLQYTLASDRTNTNVASLYNPMQPATLRLIKRIAEAGRQAGVPVAVCGEMAGDPRMAPILVGLGVNELSMTPTALPGVRTALTRKSEQEIAVLAEQVLHAQTVDEVEAIYAEFAR
jgi:phosphoenolpyruvate-protein phosphotransferase/dihydroxyacetone kinase phosphotransfer subunit